MPASALTHGEPGLWIALKPFAHLNRSTRARWSERHAEWDIRKPVRRAGAGVAVALAAAASMSVRLPRTRLMCGSILRAERANFTPHNVNQPIRVPKRVLIG